MKKKFFAMVMSGVMAVSVLAGCGSNNNTPAASGSGAASGGELLEGLGNVVGSIVGGEAANGKGRSSVSEKKTTASKTSSVKEKAGMPICMNRIWPINADALLPPCEKK